MQNVMTKFWTDHIVILYPAFKNKKKHVDKKEEQSKIR